MCHHATVEVLATQVGVTGSGLHLKLYAYFILECKFSTLLVILILLLDICRNFTINLDIPRNSDFNAIPDNLNIYCQNRRNFIITLSKHSCATVFKTRASKNYVESEKLTFLQESKKILRVLTRWRSVILKHRGI